MTGIYNPRNINVFHVEDYQWEMAMSRDSTMALDVGSFYASKSFLSDELGRVMWGWLPEERPTDPHGSPFGWAGVMSLPRQVVPYSDNNGSWYISTPPVEAVLECIRTSSVTMSNIDVGPNGVADTTIVGTQIELLLNIDSSGLRNGDECGVRVLSSAQNDQSSLEYTDIGVIFTVDLLDELQEIALYVDPSASCANNSAAVNRTVVISAPIHRDLLSSLPSLNIRVIVDHSVIESFLADGRRVITRRVYPAYPSTSTGIQLYSICGNDTDCGSCRFTTVQAWSLRTTNSISDDEKTDSSGDIDQLETWYIALICVLFVVVIAALTAVYFVFIKAPKEKIEMEQALIVQKNKI